MSDKAKKTPSKAPAKKTTATKAVEAKTAVKPTAAKASAGAKSPPHIADQIKSFSSRRVWPD